MQKIIFYGILFLLGSLVLQGQDVHFSQNYATPLYVNPAMAGLYDGDARVSAVYRNQWANLTSAVEARTIIAAVEAKLTPGPTPGGWVSGGLNLYNDRTGGVGIITNNIDFALAYNTPVMGNNQYISVGTTFGFAQRKLDLSQAQFGNQFDGVGFDENMSSNETFDNESFNHFNLSGGLVYYYIKNARNYYFGGLGVYNITSSRYSFQDFTESRLPMRFSAQFGSAISVTKTMDVVPSLYFMKQRKSIKTDVGSYARFVFSQNNRDRTFRAFNIGPFIRFSGSSSKSVSLDALIIAAKVDYDDISIGMSYDFNISKLNNATNGRGGPELSMVYTPKFRANKLSAPVSCPRF